MDEPTFIVPAGNTWGPALAVLRSMGYEVTREGNSFVASSQAAVLQAKDLLLLLGLAKLFEARGAQWHPTDTEVAEVLKLTGDE